MIRKCINCGYEYKLHMAMGSNCPLGNGKWRDTVFTTEECKCPKLQAEIAILRDVLKEVMLWVDNWTVPFKEDDEWPQTEAKVKEALKEKE